MICALVENNLEFYRSLRILHLHRVPAHRRLSSESWMRDRMITSTPLLRLGFHCIIRPAPTGAEQLNNTLPALVIIP